MASLGDHLAASLDDGSLSVIEMCGAAIILNEFIDQLEDVATEVDKDDQALEVGKKAGDKSPAGSFWNVETILKKFSLVGVTPPAGR